MPPPHSIIRSSETVVYLGMFVSTWGHVIIDNIRRLWFLKSDAFSEFKDCPIVYVPWTGEPLERQKNFRRLLEILDVDVDNLRPITQPTRFDKIILPDESIFVRDGGGRKFTAEYRETIDRLRNFAFLNRTPTPFKKIYFFYGRKQIGEERLAKYFYSKGYAIFMPEALTFDDQLNLLINCEHFATTVGSISHNSVFLRDNTEAILIPRHAESLNPFQPALNQVHPLRAFYVDSSFSIVSVHHDFNCFIISEQLKRFFGDKFDGYTEDDFKIFMKYMTTAAAMGRTVNQKELQGYGAFALEFTEQLKLNADLL